MRAYLITAAAMAASFPASAQSWEVGAMGGGGFYMGKGVSGPRGSGTVGFAPGVSGGGWIGHGSAGKLAGEIRYLYQGNNMKIDSRGSSYRFGGRTHTVTYDFLLQRGSVEDSVRPFLAFGAGLRNYSGTGVERAIQPLSNIAILTRTNQWQPVVNFGAGVKWRVGSRILIRAELRDYTSPIPKDVILPAPGAKLGGWLHDITPTIGIGYLFQ
jgi:hypothetical protein